MARTIEATRESKRLHMAKKRAENPEKVREYQRARRAANPELVKKQLRDYYAKRFFWGRAMKLRGEIRATYKELASQWKKQKGLCALTNRKLNRNAQLDHIIPKIKGGEDSIGNLRWVCAEANLAKRELFDDEFIQLCMDVLRKVGKYEL
jgi:5-methylcytosine-specific restriction endonuclease McrA